MKSEELFSIGLFVAIIALITVFGVWSEVALAFLFLEVAMCVILSVIIIHVNDKIDTSKMYFHISLALSAFATISILSAINYAINKYLNIVDLLYGIGSIFCLAVLINIVLKFDKEKEIPKS